MLKRFRVSKLIVVIVLFLVVAGSVYFYVPNYLADTIYPLKYSDSIAKYSKESNVDPALMAAIILQESRFNPQAQSPKGATGLLQFMPGTAATVAKEIGYTGKVDLYNPELSIRLGCRHIKDLLEKYNGNIDAALAGYNAGTGNADSWIARGLLGNIPFRETNNYVKKVKNYQVVYSTMYAVELGLVSPIQLKQPEVKKQEDAVAVRGLIWSKIFDNVINAF